MLKSLLFITALSVSSQATNEVDQQGLIDIVKPKTNSQKCAPQQYKFGGSAHTQPAIHAGTGKCFIDVPKGLHGNDLADFNHLSEGADVYPYEWFMSLKSLTFKDDDNKITKPFYTEMDKRFGFIAADPKDRVSYKTVNGVQRKIKYLVPWVGLSASWSTQRTDDKLVKETGELNHSADAYAEYQSADGKMIKETDVVKEITGVDGKKVKSIRMVGTNCALCHSSNMVYSNNRQFTPEFRIQGAPAMMNVRGFFKDIIGSTIAMLVKGDNLEKFLADIKKKNPSLAHINPKPDAEEVKLHFCQEIAEQTQSLGWVGEQFLTAKKICLAPTILSLLKAKKGDTARMFGAQDAIKSTYRLLLNKTYGFTMDDNIGHLEQRLNFLAFLSGGTNPAILETASAFNRTDAFGRISNLVLRTKFPVDLTAPVSLPWIWGLKYMGNLHYNGNSNSVILRNVGQALGLGAMVTSDKLDSTVNVHNLDRLENLAHKIKVPEWNDIFSEVLNKENPERYFEEFEIDTRPEFMAQGYNVYQKNCQTCHESNQLVGPNGILRVYNMYPLTPKDGEYSPNTDTRAALNAIVPVKTEVNGQVVEIPFEEKIFNDVAGIKARYYQQYEISPMISDAMEFKNIRGPEFFRDTYLGSATNKPGNNYGQIPKGNGYKAKHLSGVWATAPYLHNGSVPDMVTLLTHDSKRPKYFNVKTNDFDPSTLGFKNWKRTNDAPCDPKKYPSDEVECFNTLQVDPESGKSMGNSNRGHNWGTDLSDSDKSALINFLKYLPPEPEYSWESQEKY